MDMEPFRSLYRRLLGVDSVVAALGLAFCFPGGTHVVAAVGPVDAVATWIQNLRGSGEHYGAVVRQRPEGEHLALY
jgi:hypothetical protein